MAHTDHPRPARRKGAVLLVQERRRSNAAGPHGRRRKNYRGRGSRCNVLLRAVFESAEAYA